ncbi:hypothetical protein NON00_20750 [Roseomonas sp. GC11]|uniref:hypothetical protein n=1 Tax=Roseomonas sp. GC11 TaxID=2950546 RepID=UPI002109A021|nr:hypothetical protein [Roseomonas sp. GC11]MCQ4162345.1 hypothetical protein [Roseomonas sp. GC11]
MPPGTLVPMPDHATETASSPGAPPAPPPGTPLALQAGRPRIAVIGTSNSVAAGGWARVVQQAVEVVEASNLSLGFCSSDLFAFRREAMDFAALDLCLVDFACNDGTLLASHSHAQRQVEAALRAMVSETTRQGCLPVLMILPVNSFRPDGGRIAALYRAVAEKFALPFFDGYAFLNRLCATPEMEGVALFKDNMHLDNPVSVQLGRMVVELLPGLAARRDLAAPLRRSTGFRYRYFPAGPAIRRGFTRLRRETALIGVDLVEIQSETAADFRLPNGYEATGLVADFGHSHTLLTASGTRSVRLHVASKHDGAPPEKMVLGIWPMPRPVPEMGGFIRLTIGRGRNWDVTTDHSVKPVGEEEAPRLALAGLVARERQAELPWRALLPGALDLCALVPEARFAMARAALRGGR